MKTHKHKCGCISEVGDRERWVYMCTEHEAEFQSIHQRWSEEHKSRKAEPDEKEAKRKLKKDGWYNHVRFEEMEFGSEDVLVIFNGY